MLRTVFGVLVVVLFAGPAFADYKTGLDAFRGGNYEFALKQWLPLAEKGHAKAQNSVGFMHARGLGVPPDHREAIKWYTKSAKQDFPLAAYNLGLIYTRGTGTLPNQEKATDWFRRAAGVGHLKAQIAYAERLRDGVGTEEDLAAAYAWLVVAADQAKGKEETRIGSSLSRLVARMSGSEVSKAVGLAERVKARVNEAMARVER